MSIINNTSPTSFNLIFPAAPMDSSLKDQKYFTLKITDTVLPAFTINPIKIPTKGVDLHGEGGKIEYGKWNTTFFIDENWDSYMWVYKWMENIANGYNILGQANFDYQIEADLLITDNYENTIVEFSFFNIWPSNLGEIQLDYQQRQTYVTSKVTFTYDYFYKK